MSMFSFPDAITPDAMMKSMPDLTEMMNDMPALPMSPLMAHPVAASAAATALGVGLAGHMSGLFWGSVQGAMDSSLRWGARTTEAAVDLPKPTSNLTRSKSEAPVGKAPQSSAATAMPGRKTVEGVSHLKTAAAAAAGAVKEAEEKPLPSKADTAEPLQAEDFRRPLDMERPVEPDDLKRISGIGPKLEQVLNGLGIWSFDQIVALTAAETAWLDDYLQFRGRIERDGWQKQAAELMNPAS